MKNPEGRFCHSLESNPPGLRATHPDSGQSSQGKRSEAIASTTKESFDTSTGKHFMTYHRREISALCLQTGLPLTHSRNTCPTGLG